MYFFLPARFHPLLLFLPILHPTANNQPITEYCDYILQQYCIAVGLYGIPIFFIHVSRTLSVIWFTTDRKYLVFTFYTLQFTTAATAADRVRYRYLFASLLS